jgi:Tol biopolymer transport system component
VTFQPDVKGAAPYQLTQPQPGVANLDPAFAPMPNSSTIAFIKRTAHGTQLCFAVIGKFAINSSCTSAPGWELGRQVDWSPDGKTILVLGVRNGGPTFGLIAFSSNVAFSTNAALWGQGTPQTDTSVPGHGVSAGEFSPDGKQVALVSNIGGNDFKLYIAKAGNFKVPPAAGLPVRACQVSWRSDGQELAVLQPDGLCTSTAIGTIVGVDLADPSTTRILATQAADPAWQPAPTGG